MRIPKDPFGRLLEWIGARNRSGKSVAAVVSEYDSKTFRKASKGNREAAASPSVRDALHRIDPFDQALYEEVVDSVTELAEASGKSAAWSRAMVDVVERDWMAHCEHVRERFSNAVEAVVDSALNEGAGG